MNKKLKTDAVDYLFDAILSLKNRDECYSFFEDLCTVNELLSLSQRFEVAAMLKSHKTYLEIADKTGASTATISRVTRSLNYGNDGYDLVFDRITQKLNSNYKKEGLPQTILLFYVSAFTAPFCQNPWKQQPVSRLRHLQFLLLPLL